MYRSALILVVVLMGACALTDCQTVSRETVFKETMCDGAPCVEVRTKPRHEH